MNADGLQLSALGKSFGDLSVLREFSLDVRPGEIVAVTGPSGVGKTTVCRLVSGLDAPDTGAIVLDGKDLTALPAQQRSAAYMFESYALYPHLNVSRNIAFPLASPANRRKYDRAAVEAKVAELLRLTEIEPLRKRRPGELSGGQKQRVALCRALVQDAAIYLLDEPISHLDAKLRNELRGAIRRRQTALEAVTLWSTPDAMEALSVADRVAVLMDGKLQQFDVPEEIYFHPVSTSVARLVGDPAMNLLAGEVRRDNGATSFVGPGLSLPLPEALGRRLDRARRSSVILGVRPNAMEIVGSEATGPVVPMRVYAWEPSGKYSIVTAQLGDDLVRIKTPRTDRFEIDCDIAVAVDPASVLVFDGESRLAL